jgi:hypothetical protein
MPGKKNGRFLVSQKKEFRANTHRSFNRADLFKQNIEAEVIKKQLLIPKRN